MNFSKGIKLDFICMKMKLMKNNKKYFSKKNSRKELVPETTADITSWVSKSYVPFTCKSPMAMYFVPIFHSWYRSKTNFYVLVTTKLMKNFVRASLWFFLAVFIAKFQKKIPLSELCEKRYIYLDLEVWPTFKIPLPWPYLHNQKRYGFYISY